MRYIGNKTNILTWLKECILKVITENNVPLEQIDRFYDLFSGTGSVAELFKDCFNITGNDILESSFIITKAKLLKKIPEEADRYIGILNTQSTQGFITEKYSEGSRLYFSKENGMCIDGMIQYLKQNIDNQSELYYYLMFCILDAIHTVSNTTGVYGAFLKTLNSNSKKKIMAKKIDIKQTDKNHLCFNKDCIQLLESIKENDIIYIDPPYNSRQYSSNYHLLETIVKYDNPNIKLVKGQESKTGLRSDLINSKWCSKKHIEEELVKVLESKSKFIFLSYNNEGLLEQSKIEEIMGRYGNVTVFKKEHKKYKSNKNNNERIVYELLLCCVK